MRQSDKRLVLGFSQAVMNLPFRLANVESAKAAARRADARLLVTDGKGSREIEARNIKCLLDDGVDALIVSSLSGEAIYPTYREANERGVPLIIFASGVPLDDTPYTSFVAPDEESMGRRAADYIGSRLEGEGAIVVVQGLPESTNSRLRKAGFSAELKRAFPKIEIVGRGMGGWLRQPAREFMEKLLPTVGRIDAVFAENDEMALGVVDALRLWRRQAETFVVGLDGQYEALRRIAQGSPLVMTIKSEWDSGAAVDVAVAAARGLEVPRRIVLEAPAIDQTNVEEFLGDNVRIW
jgi:ABC-type sugar transport system substrate-binding protein